MSESAKKREEVLDSGSHVVEIDLLRKGKPFIARTQVPPCDYLVYVSWRKNERARRGLAWPILLHQRLPVIPVPLRKPDPDVQVDLQQVLNTVYDSAGYDLDIDYRRPPNPPLREERAAWAREVMGSQGGG